MDMNTREHTLNYFWKYKCRLLTLWSVPFRNLIASICLLLLLRLFSFFESKNICLCPSTPSFKVHKVMGHWNELKITTFFMKPLQKFCSCISCLYIKNRKKKKKIIHSMFLSHLCLCCFSIIVICN